MNSVILIGRLTADPELRFIPRNGTAVATSKLAVDKGLSREKKQELEQQGKPTADFPRIIVFGSRAENCASYLAKGRLVAIHGKIQTGSYETPQGEKRYTTEVLGEKVEFLEWGDKQKDSIDYDGFSPVEDDEIPF